MEVWIARILLVIVGSHERAASVCFGSRAVKSRHQKKQLQVGCWTRTHVQHPVWRVQRQKLGIFLLTGESDRRKRSRNRDLDRPA
jgi:hypothetical protein